MAELCSHCVVGYFPPFQRFERVAVIPDGPEFLTRCNVCGALWSVELHVAQRVTPQEAQHRFPDYVMAPDA
jgi:hypothetical protein